MLISARGGKQDLLDNDRKLDAKTNTDDTERSERRKSFEEEIVKGNEWREKWWWGELMRENLKIGQRERQAMSEVLDIDRQTGH